MIDPRSKDVNTNCEIFFHVLPCAPSRKIPLWLEGENSESNNDSWGEEKRLNDDANVVKRHDHTDGVSLNHSLKK